MGISVETLQRFVAGGMATQRLIDRALAKNPLRLGDVVGFFDDPHDMLRRLPITTQSTYVHGDRHDAMVTVARLRTCGSIVESVCLEIAADQLRERAGR